VIFTLVLFYQIGVAISFIFLINLENKLLEFASELQPTCLADEAWYQWACEHK